MLLERCHMSNWWSTSGKFLFMSALIHDTWQHCNNYNSPPTQMSNTPNLSRVVFTSRQIESSCDQNQKWGQGTWSVVLEVRGWQEQRGGGGLKKLAKRLHWIWWRQFILARVDWTACRSVRERQRKYLSAMRKNKWATDEIYVIPKAMRRNKCATHVTFVVL